MARNTLFVFLPYCIASSTFFKAVSLELVTHRLSERNIQCYPVTCHVGFQASFCKQDRTTDYCHLCPVGSSQDQTVDTRTLHSQDDVPKCSRIDIACLQPETTPVVENGRIVRCECDLTNGYIGEDPLCIKVNSCVHGEQLEKSSGRCLPCPNGSFKDTAGYELCQPWTSCVTLGRETLKAGNATVDTVCGKRLQTTVKERSVNPTTNTFTVAIQCGAGDCLNKAHQTESKEDAVDNTLQQQDMTSQHHSNDCYDWRPLLAVVTAGMILILITVPYCLLRMHRLLTRRIGKGYQYSMKEEKDIERCIKQGIQEETEMAKQDKETDFEKTTPIDDDDHDQPATLYPLINEHPTEPSAPELSLQGISHPLKQVPPSCSAKDPDFKAKIYVQKGNYD